MLRDSDSCTYNAVKDLYQVTKEECINHVNKSLGYHFRKVKDVAAKEKISTGGNGIEQLTKVAIERFQIYYSSAVSTIIYIFI